MAKGKLTKTELEEKKLQLQEECQKLKKIIEASDTSTFEIMIDDIKKEMVSNIAEENWKTLKQNKCKVEKFREIVKIIQNQGELLEQKEDELADVEWEIEHYQPSLFEQQEQTTEPLHEEDTNITVNNHRLLTGDIFKAGDSSFAVVSPSQEIEGKYALYSNYFEGERMLQYPANQDLLLEMDFIGNFYTEKDKEKEKILCKALESIQEYNQMV